MNDFTYIKPVSHLLNVTQDIATPKAQGKWSPISHYEVLRRTIVDLEREGYKVEGGTLTLMDRRYIKKKKLLPNAKMWATLLVTHAELSSNPELNRTVNIINSHDKSKALQLSVGAVVLRCMNGMWGIQQTFDTKKKHTRGEHTDAVVHLKNMLVKVQKELVTDSIFKEYIEFKNKLQNQQVVIPVEFDKIEEAKVLPIVDVENAFKYRKSNDCLWKNNTMWDLYNLFTQVAKYGSMSKQLVTHKKLYNYFNTYNND